MKRSLRKVRTQQDTVTAVSVSAALMSASFLVVCVIVQESRIGARTIESGYSPGTAWTNGTYL
ncbi:MAG: hypothetical protein WAR83_08740 [Flavobacteriales bacterium]|nr:hypothetical protein [Flavobacteriales bacterium]